MVLGIAAATVIGAVGPTLTASSSTGGGDDFFGLGAVSARTVTDQVTLEEQDLGALGDGALAELRLRASASSSSSST